MRNKIGALSFLFVLQGSAMAEGSSIEERLNSLLGNAANVIVNSNATQQQKKDAAQTIQFCSVAKEVNADKTTSMEEKNRLCHSKGKALASLNGSYDVNFLGMCNEVFN